MRTYKGFSIVPVYHIGSTFTVHEDGRVTDRKPTAKDIAYYVVVDPIDYDKRWIAENTIEDCKNSIDQFLAKAGMEDNKPETWAKLDWGEDGVPQRILDMIKKK
jgi:hypothetical protein